VSAAKGVAWRTSEEKYELIRGWEGRESSKVRGNRDLREEAMS